MGGRGSGRQSSFGLSASKTSDYHAIDLAWLRREKLLNVGRRSTITWSRGDRETGSIRVEVLRDALRLVYRTRRHEGEWRDVRDTISLVSTQTQFGGHRQWFECPSCLKRCRIIYGGSYFRCRRCHGLHYESQYEPAFARQANRARRLRKMLGGPEGVDDLLPEKPKGMHWANLRSRDRGD